MKWHIIQTSGLFAAQVMYKTKISDTSTNTNTNTNKNTKWSEFY